MIYSASIYTGLRGFTGYREGKLFNLLGKLPGG